MFLRELTLLITIYVISTPFSVADEQTKWGEWSEFGPCDQTCGTNGYKTRTRRCEVVQDVTSEESDNCNEGEVDESKRKCKLPLCEGTKWGEWSKYGQCTKTCGTGGYRSKTRQCEVVQNINSEDVDNCDEGEVDEAKVRCKLPVCKVDGGWGPWSEWSECESINCTSEKGYQYKFRSCTKPIPQNGGSMCQGELVNYRECFEPTNCPVDGNWGNWTKYECSKEDGEYVAKRFRNCTNPAPKFGGQKCDQNLAEEIIDRNTDIAHYDTICEAFAKTIPPPPKDKPAPESVTAPIVDDYGGYDYNVE